MKKTSLTRKQYTGVANNWIKQNPELWNAIRAATNDKPFPILNEILTQQYGVPYWRDRKGNSKITGKLPTKNDPGVEFRPENKGNDRVGYKSVVTRKDTRGVTKRAEAEKISTPKLTPKQERAFATVMAKAASKGLQGDHIVSINRTANAIKGMGTRRTIQYFKNLLNAGVYTGNQAENIQELSPKANRSKFHMEQKMDKSIDNAGKLQLNIFGGKKSNNSPSKGRLSIGAINAKTKSTAGFQLDDLFESKTHLSPFGPVYKFV